VPLNPDVAGLIARTETDFAAWFSPAGYARGNISNVIKLAFNPSKQEEMDYTVLESIMSLPSLALEQFYGETKLSRLNQVPLIEFKLVDSSTFLRSLLLHQQTLFSLSRTMHLLDRTL
jgi:hypothetical protein